MLEFASVQQFFERRLFHPSGQALRISDFQLGLDQNMPPAPARSSSSVSSFETAPERNSAGAVGRDHESRVAAYAPLVAPPAPPASRAPKCGCTTAQNNDAGTGTLHRLAPRCRSDHQPSEQHRGDLSLWRLPRRQSPRHPSRSARAHRSTAARRAAHSPRPTPRPPTCRRPSHSRSRARFPGRSSTTSNPTPGCGPRDHPEPAHPRPVFPSPPPTADPERRRGSRRSAPLTHPGASTWLDEVARFPGLRERLAQECPKPTAICGSRPTRAPERTPARGLGAWCHSPPPPPPPPPPPLRSAIRATTRSAADPRTLRQPSHPALCSRP